MARAKQEELPGVERQSIPELNEAIELYDEKRGDWVKARTEVQAAKAKLMELARTHGITIYRDDNAVPPLVLTLKEREAVLKVTPVDGVEMVDDEDEGDAEELVS